MWTPREGQGQRLAELARILPQEDRLMNLSLRGALAALALAVPPLFAAPPGDPLWSVDTGG